ncbi:zinc finger protein 541 isoform X2 [Hoplias malabaricus]|uniref:zinc finger protein 541 isoform X2 n=1 Tax=Hoplias malabaricus TaxID=27720 RepID=UPI003461FC1B
MEALDSSDENSTFLSGTENFPDDVVFINPLTPPLPSLEDQLWVDPDSGVGLETGTGHGYMLAHQKRNAHCCAQPCGHSSYTGFASVVGNIGLNSYQEETCLFQKKLPMISEAWSSAVVDLPGSHVPLNWEDNLDFPVTNHQSTKWDVTNTGMEHALRPFPTYHKKSQPVLLKHSRPQLKPQNKQQVSNSHNELESVALQPLPHQRETIHAPPVESKGRKNTMKKNNTKAAKTSAPLLPAPRASSQRKSRPRTAQLVSPSEVAMASFRTDSVPSLTLKGRSAYAAIHDGRETTARSTNRCSIAECVLQNGEKPDKAAGQIHESHLSPLVIPVSVPVENKQQKVKGQSKKSCHADLLSSLIIPRSTELRGQGCRCLAAGGYPSQLRSPTYFADHMLKPGFLPPLYTPPPMLSPLRPGTGLYFSTLPQCYTCPKLPSICTSSLDKNDMISLMIDDTVVSIEPINVGSRFQAEIPPLRNRLLMLYDEHPAQLVWAPWGDLPSNPETQQKVTEFLNMCSSSVLPGGGTNIELALHCLYEVQGDILAALDLLLVRGDYYTSSHPLSDYHYAGSDQWSAQEMRRFRKAFVNHNKDFQLIHTILQTKSVAQCVEYYYTVKKLKKFKHRSRGTDKTNRFAENSGSRLYLEEPRLHPSSALVKSHM